MSLRNLLLHDVVRSTVKHVMFKLKMLESISAVILQSVAKYNSIVMLYDVTQLAATVFRL